MYGLISQFIFSININLDLFMRFLFQGIRCYNDNNKLVAFSVKKIILMKI